MHENLASLANKKDNKNAPKCFSKREGTYEQANFCAGTRNANANHCRFLQCSHIEKGCRADRIKGK